MGTPSTISTQCASHFFSLRAEGQLLERFRFRRRRETNAASEVEHNAGLLRAAAVKKIGHAQTAHPGPNFVYVVAVGESREG